MIAMKYLLDTNILIENCDNVDDFDEVVICSQTLEELDGLKKSEGLTGFQARQAIKKLEKSDVQYIVQDLYVMPEGWDIAKRDNQILMCAKQNGCILISNDINVIIKARSLGLECDTHKHKKEVDIYTGYREITMSEYDQSVFYQCMLNSWDLLINQYLIIRDENTGEVIDQLKWTVKGFSPVYKKPLDSMMFGKTKAKDVYQQLAIDSLNNDDITILTGAAGTGKTMFSLAYMFQKLQSNKIDKMIIIFNGIPILKSSQIGYLPGGKDEKILSGSLGGILASKLGDMHMVETLINQGKLMLVPLCNARGFEATDNSVLYITEGQNMDIYLLKTVLQRAKDGTKVIIEGDIEEQVDNYAFANDKNGMRRAIEVFKGETEFSCVKLKNIYRGRIAEIANEM